MSFTALQSASIIAAQSTFTKMSVTFGLRLWQLLEKDEKKRKEMEFNETIQRVMAAQMNEAEYAPLLVAILLFLHNSYNSSSSGGDTTGANLVHWGGTLAVVSQVGYFWCRVLAGFPTPPVGFMATVRYGSLGLLCGELLSIAFPSKTAGKS